MTYPPEDDQDTASRRALPRLAPAARLSVAVENATSREAVGLAEVADFSGLGVGLSGLPCAAALAPGDDLWLTLVAEDSLIPLRATLAHRTGEGRLGCRLDTPEAAGQQFLLRLYERARSRTRGAEHI